MKKILIIGCPGSGKSTFSRALHQKTGLPLVHLDQLYWNADKTTVEPAIFRERLTAVLQQDAWIVDGDYASTMEQRLHACDTVIFLDYPLEVCLNGIAARKGQPRSDMPWIDGDGEDDEFLELIRSYRSQKRPRVMTLLKTHSDKVVHIFHSREDADIFLSQL